MQDGVKLERKTKDELETNSARSWNRKISALKKMK